MSSFLNLNNFQKFNCIATYGELAMGQVPESDFNMEENQSALKLRNIKNLLNKINLCKGQNCFK